MPIDKYMYIRKAAEVEEIIFRMQMISDMNAAFAGAKDKLTELHKTYTEIMGFDVKWEADPNWEDKLRYYASVQK